MYHHFSIEEEIIIIILRKGSTPDQKNYGQCSIFDS